MKKMPKGTKQPKPTFTPEQEVKLKELLWGTWEYIGSDVMSALESEGKYSIPQAEIIEVVLDADYMEMSQARTPFDKEVLKKFRELAYKDQIAFAKKNVFTFGRYS